MKLRSLKEDDATSISKLIYKIMNFISRLVGNDTVIPNPPTQKSAPGPIMGAEPTLQASLTSRQSHLFSAAQGSRPARGQGQRLFFGGPGT